MAEKSTTNEEKVPQEKPLSDEIASNPNLLAALSYLWVLSVVMYVLKKDNDYIEFHSRQGMVIFAISIIGMFLWLIPPVAFLIWLLTIVLIIIGFLKAYQGERFKFPVISDFAEKINF